MIMDLEFVIEQRTLHVYDNPLHNKGIQMHRRQIFAFLLEHHQKRHLGSPQIAQAPQS